MYKSIVLEKENHVTIGFWDSLQERIRKAIKPCEEHLGSLGNQLEIINQQIIDPQLLIIIPLLKTPTSVKARRYVPREANRCFLGNDLLMSMMLQMPNQTMDNNIKAKLQPSQTLLLPDQQICQYLFRPQKKKYQKEVKSSFCSLDMPS